MDKILVLQNIIDTFWINDNQAWKPFQTPISSPDEDFVESIIIDTFIVPLKGVNWYDLQW